MARDNTVKYRQSTLQLLPGAERPTYAGLKVDVLESLDGQLIVEHEGRVAPSQEAPPRPNTLRGIDGHSSPTPPDRNGLGSRVGDGSGIVRQGESRREQTPSRP